MNYSISTNYIHTFSSSLCCSDIFLIFFVCFYSQVFGSIWYLCSVEREAQCWHDACSKHPGCNLTSLYCGYNYSHEGNLFLNASCPIEKPNVGIFNFGIFLQALQSDIGESHFPKKFLHCFWWGLRNLRYAVHCPSWLLFLIERSAINLQTSSGTCFYIHIM